jgi:hypothetical protein
MRALIGDEPTPELFMHKVVTLNVKSIMVSIWFIGKEEGPG